MNKVMEYKGYQGSVDFSLEDRVLHGKILHINDLVTFEAESIAALEEAFREAVEDYLEFCEEEGVDPDKPCSGTFNIRVGPDIHRRLSLVAARTGVSLNDTVKGIMESSLKNDSGRMVVTHHHVHEHRIGDIGGDNAYAARMELPRRPPAPELRVVK